MGDAKDTTSIPAQLEHMIKDGNFPGVRNLLDEVNGPESIDCIVKQFSDRDPVICAIDCKRENIALYLIEKSFPTTTFYTHNTQQCDQWCYQDHRAGDPCPADYNALCLARQHKLSRVVTVLQEIRDGVRRAGDGLAELQGPPRGGGSMERQHRDCKPSHESNQSQCNTSAAQAKARIQEAGVGYISKNGDTLLHEAVAAGLPMIHVAANHQVPVNAQNFDGDTALHVAIRQNNYPAARALLSCGADITLRNKLGQQPCDLTAGKDMSELLATYRPGVVKAIQTGDFAALQRLIQLWMHPCSNIKGGKSALDLARSRQNADQQAANCYGLLKQHIATLRLVQAVLGEDTKEIKEILQQASPHLNINTRFKCKRGATLLSCAIEQGSLDTVKILLNSRKCHLSTRVPENMDRPDGPCMPLYFKTLAQDCPIPVWRFVNKMMELSEDFEKDEDGNMPLLRAIQNGKDIQFMEQLFKDLTFNRLLMRNKEGQTAKDLALSLGRNDIVDLINKTILSGCGQGYMAYIPVSFYGRDKIRAIKDQNGGSLLDVAIHAHLEEDIQALKHYKHIESLGCELFTAAAKGDIKVAEKLNNADFIDQNGYTALTRAVVYNQPQMVEALMVHRPELRLIGDNCNRYPLHYAYAMPEEQSCHLVDVLLARAPEGVQHKMDKDGRAPVEYKDLRDTPEILQLLYDARTLDPHRKRGAPLAELPPGAQDPPHMVPAPGSETSEALTLENES